MTGSGLQQPSPRSAPEQPDARVGTSQGGASQRKGQVFLGLGATRCGTTWLYERLREHPQVMMSPLKEMHWFDGEEDRVTYERSLAREAQAILQRLADDGSLPVRGKSVLRRLSLRSDVDYLNYFHEWRRPRHRAMGEITPGYSVLEVEDFRRMVDLDAEMRFVFVMRNPADRLWSNYRFHAQRVGRRIPERYWPGNRKGSVMSDIRRRGDYGRTLDSLWSVAPRSQVHLMFFEHLFDPDRSAEVMAGLYAFLGVDDRPPDVEWLAQKVNDAGGPSLDPGDRARIVKSQRNVYEWSERHLGNLPGSWTADIRKFLD